MVTLAVYTFLLACLIGRQFLEPSHGYPGHDLDLYVPVFTLLQFFFYCGWLKVRGQGSEPHSRPLTPDLCLTSGGRAADQPLRRGRRRLRGQLDHRQEPSGQQPITLLTAAGAPPTQGHFLFLRVQVSLLAVDEMHMDLPPMSRDAYWNDCEARPPYTRAAADSCIRSFLGSTTDMGSRPSSR